MGNLRHVEFRDLPGVDELSQRLAADPEIPDLPEPLVGGIAREAIERARWAIRGGGDDPDPVADATATLLSLAAHRPRRVINATGVLLHTNLGRAPLHEDAAGAGRVVAAGYGNVEFDLSSGSRGGRGAYVTKLLTSLTGAEAALVVNNNAGGLFLALAALAGGRVAAVSRGELIEIGGSFRLPELMAASGAELLEVGTTNRTRGTDYEAVAADADLVLKVHPSNYRIEGFSEEVGYRELAKIAHTAGLPCVADLGSGLLDTRTPWLSGPPPPWLADEPGVRQTLEMGADVVLFSGDKLLGGPQAGIVVGGRDLVDAMARHPVARAVRIGGVTMAMLGRTLELYASGRGGDVPFWRMASLPVEGLEHRHRRVLEESGVRGRVVEGDSVPGAGSVPGATIPSPNLELDVPADASWKSLITSRTPIVGRRHGDALRLDLRTVDPEDDALVIVALTNLTKL